MTEPDTGHAAPLEERLEDHLDRRVARLVALSMRGDFEDDSGLRLAQVGGRISELLRATQLLEDTRSGTQRFIDAVAYAHRDNVRRRREGDDVRCGCRLTMECARIDVSPRFLARLSGFGDPFIEELAALDASSSRYDPGKHPVTIWQAVRDDAIVEDRVVPRARERLATALMWALSERLPGSAFELGEAAAALADLVWMDEDAAWEICEAFEEAHQRLTTPERMQALGFEPEDGHCACRTTANCQSAAISPRSIVRQLKVRGLIKELEDPELEERLLAMDVTGTPDPADATAPPSRVGACPAAVAGPLPDPPPAQRRDPAETANLRAEVLALLRASPRPLAAREIAAISDADLDGRRVGQLLRGLRTRGLVERHTFSDENTGWTTTTWTAADGDEP